MRLDVDGPLVLWRPQPFTGASPAALLVLKPVERPAVGRSVDVVLADPVALDRTASHPVLDEVPVDDRRPPVAIPLTIPHRRMITLGLVILLRLMTVSG